MEKTPWIPFQCVHSCKPLVPFGGNVVDLSGPIHLRPAADTK
jgi:hypothetical protein